MHEAVNTRGGKFFDSGYCLVFTCTPLGRRSRVTPHITRLCLLFVFKLSISVLRKLRKWEKVWQGVQGIGFFYTRKGQFQYNISLYIIIYHDDLILYLVSSSVSDISCCSPTHDISLFHLFLCCMWNVVSCGIYHVAFFMIHATCDTPTHDKLI